MNRAIDHYVYGIPCLRVFREGKMERIIVTINEDDPLEMKILHIKTGKKEKYKLSIFQDVDLDMERGEIRNVSEKQRFLINHGVRQKNFITLLTTLNDTCDLIFDKIEELDNFIFAYIYFAYNKYNEADDNLK